MTQFTFASQLGHIYTLIVVMFLEYRGVALLLHSAKPDSSFARFDRDRTSEIRIEQLVIKIKYLLYFDRCFFQLI